MIIYPTPNSWNRGLKYSSIKKVPVTVGSELVVNPDFSGTWSSNIPQGFSLAGSQDASNYLVGDDTNNTLRIVNVGGGSAATGVSQNILTQIYTYRVSVNVLSITGSFHLQYGTQLIANISAPGLHSFDLIDTDANTSLYCHAYTYACDATINLISCKRLT